MMFDVITISDDEEEVQFLDHIVNIEKPPVIDLTSKRIKKKDSLNKDESDEPRRPPQPGPSQSPSPRSPSPHSPTHYHQSNSQHSSPSQSTPPQSPPTQAGSQHLFAKEQSSHQAQTHHAQPNQRPPKSKSPSSVPNEPTLASERPSNLTQTNSNQPLRTQPQPSHLDTTTQQPTSNNYHQPSSQSPQPPRPPPPRPSDEALMNLKKERGNLNYRGNSFNEAIRNYKEAADLAKKLNNQDMSAILHFNLAMSYDKLGAYNQAADECAAAVRLNDKYIKAHVKRAEIYMSQGKYEEAVICYEHICELDTTKKDDAIRRMNLAKELSKKTKKRDQHEILGLRPHFSLDDLRASYKQKARAHHPDKHSDADIVTRRIQEKIFKEASEAYSFFRKRFG